MGNKRDEGSGEIRADKVWKVGSWGIGGKLVSEEAMDEEMAEAIKTGHRANGRHAIKMPRSRGKHGG